MSTILRPEHPRPQFVREDWINLNGTWQFAFDHGMSGEERKLYLEKLPLTITVPFCPESRLSGIGYTDFIGGCWYKRTLTVPESWSEGRVLLHFGAVDYLSSIWVNGKLAGRHEGGYASFTVDITDLVHPGENDLAVGAINDPRSGNQPAGKQSTRYYSHGCSYTRTTGIWQTVWAEHVSDLYLKKIFLAPDVENCGVHIRAVLNDYASGEGFNAQASFEGADMGAVACRAFGREVRVFLPLKEEHLWEVGCGRLYDLKLALGSDRVTSYFGLRSVALRDGSFLLNGKNVYQRTVLDQGFNPEGIITAPTDEFLRGDIERSVAMGFNGARLHQKIFEARFLYWADRLGYLVWGEHANWCLDVKDGNGLMHFLPEWMESVERDYSSPALIGWCPFNETQGDTEPRVLSTVWEYTAAMDPTRPVIDTSGWVHCDRTDVYDWHDYTQDPDTFRAHVEKYASVQKGEPFEGSVHIKGTPAIVSGGQPLFISEYGGIGWKMAKAPGDAWGYGEGPKTEEEFLTRLKGLTDACLQTKGIMGYCYTQLTDVEQECNGLYTYDRTAKFPAETIAAIFRGKAWNEH